MTDRPTLRVLPYGDDAVLVELPGLDEVRALDDAVRARAQPTRTPPASSTRSRRAHAPAARCARTRTPARSPVARGGRRGRPGPLRPRPVSVVLEVDYDGPDLADVAALTGLTVDEVVARHTGRGVHGGVRRLHARLRVPRRPGPRRCVSRGSTPRASASPPGSVAIADEFSAVYPAATPGGWRLLGPVRRDPLRRRPGARRRCCSPAPACGSWRHDGRALEVARPGRAHARPGPGPARLGAHRGRALGRGRRGVAAAGQPAGRQRRGRRGARGPARRAAGAGRRGRDRRAHRCAGADRGWTADRSRTTPCSSWRSGVELRLGTSPRACGRTSRCAAGSTCRPSWGRGPPTSSRASDRRRSRPVTSCRSGPRRWTGRWSTSHRCRPPARRDVELPVRARSAGRLVRRRLATALRRRVHGDARDQPGRGPAERDRRSPARPTPPAGSCRRRAWSPAPCRCPPDGQPVVFGVDHPVTGGYPVVAVVRRPRIGRLAQVRPGDRVSFVRGELPGNPCLGAGSV